MQRAGRAILVQVVAFVVVIAAAAIAVAFWYQGQNYVDSQDAQVSAPLAPVGSLAVGTLTSWRVRTGEAVTQGETLGTVLVPPAASPTVVVAATTAAATPAAKASVTPVPARTGPTVLKIVAPLAGTVVHNLAVSGETVTPGAPLVYIADLRNPTITAYIKETAIRNVAVGQRVDTTIDAFPGTKFQGTVQRIGLATAATFSLLPTTTQSGAFTPVTQRVPVVISLSGPAGGLIPGESASVRIHLH